ncbi:MAG: CHAP domain-containing protein [Marmoricola sp.]
MQTRWKTRHGLVIALVGLIATLLVPAAPAQATSTILCKGFTACANAGYSSFGYGPTNYKKMWWRMYSGHNCTNYMSYRMIQSGMPATRPWTGSGDARNWGIVFKSKANQTPLVGSVAWWSSNHVAYVQQVIDANTIIISEDHYGGDFDWRKIVRTGGGWPTGFIHLEDESVAPTVAPTVVGTPQVDKSLSVKAGTWNRTGVAFKYQWLANGVVIPAATATTYVPTAAQVGSTFTVKVSATKAGYKPGSSVTAVTPATLPGVMTAAAAPVLSGFVKVGGLLRATVPTWTPAPTGIRYAWFADGTAIPGASGTSLTLGPDQLGKKITAVATATRVGYTTTTKTSAATPAVLPEKLAVTKEPTLVGTPHTGHALTVKPGTVSPGTVTTTYQWLRDGVAIKGANAATYTPSAADPGTRLSVRVSYVKPGYTTVTRELALSKQVRSYAKFYLRSTEHRSVTVTVRADGVPVVHGEVELTMPSGKHRTLTLVNGRAVFSATWLYAGTRNITFSYLGSYRVEERTVVRSVVVK